MNYTIPYYETIDLIQWKEKEIHLVSYICRLIKKNEELTTNIQTTSFLIFSFNSSSLRLVSSHIGGAPGNVTRTTLILSVLPYNNDDKNH